MPRITYIASLCLTVIWLAMMACSGGPNTTGNNNCQADHNCLANEKCSEGKCVSASSVPNQNNNTTSNTNNTNTNNVNNANTNTNTNTNNVNNANTNTNTNNVNNANTNTNNVNTNTNNNNTNPKGYPDGPYGADVGDVAIPLEFANCDDSKKMNFKDFYQDPKIKVLLVTVHTGW